MPEVKATSAPSKERRAMMVKTDFPYHWKTQTLIASTDEGAVFALIKLWAHCQNSRRWEFPEMTPEQLHKICLWGKRDKPCHEAFLEAGFLDSLPGGGFAVHDFDDHNAGLVENWKNGARGGRKKKTEKLDADKPTGNQSETSREPIDQTNHIDRIGKTEENQPTRQDASPLSGPRMESSPIVGSAGAGLVASKKPIQYAEPTMELVSQWLRHCQEFKNESDQIVEQLAEYYFHQFESVGWIDAKGKDIKDWKPHSIAYCKSTLAEWKKKKSRH